jgi:hypothetical protein
VVHVPAPLLDALVAIKLAKVMIVAVHPLQTHATAKTPLLPRLGVRQHGGELASHAVDKASPKRWTIRLGKKHAIPNHVLNKVARSIHLQSNSHVENKAHHVSTHLHPLSRHALHKLKVGSRTTSVVTAANVKLIIHPTSHDKIHLVVNLAPLQQLARVGVEDLGQVKMRRKEAHGVAAQKSYKEC